MDQPRSLDLSFGWTESPTDHLWHFGEAKAAEGAESGTFTFHARCGQLYRPSQAIAEAAPAGAAVCEECGPAN